MGDDVPPTSEENQLKPVIMMPFTGNIIGVFYGFSSHYTRLPNGGIRKQIVPQDGTD